MKHDSHIIGAVSSLVAMLLLLLLLWLVYLDKPFVPEEEGIEVTMADMEEIEEVYKEPASAPAPAGSAAPAAAQEETTTKPAKVTTTVPSKPVVTQEDPSVAAAKAAKEEAERLARAEAAARKAAEEAAAAKKAEEDKKRAAAQNLMAGKFGSGSGSGTGSTDTPGSGSARTDNPVGKGSGANGSSWALAGRSLKGTLNQPQYNSDSEGKVVVRIRVNAEGKVIEASQGQGTTTSDKALIDAAIAAAKKAVFSSGTGDVIGSITYVFKLS